MLEITVAELADAQELDLGTSPWLVMTQARVDTFADATNDQQWIHVDAERAADGPFGGTIAHGYLTLSLVPYLLKQLMVISDHGRGTNYGLEKVRFTSVVPVGAEVRLAATIPNAVRREDGGVQYRVALRIEVLGEERPAMVGESVYLTYPTT
jgi:acyl dehydratase